MDVSGKFSLEEMLTAIERRLPGGRVVSKFLIAALVVWLVVYAIAQTIEILSPVFQFLRTREWPSYSVDDAAATVLTLAVFVILIILVSRTFSKVRKEIGDAENRLKRVSVIASLIQAKEVATHGLLNWVLPDNDPDAKRKWIKKIEAWEEGTERLLREADATEAELSDFRTVVSFTPTGPAVDKEHADWKGKLAERIRRLSNIIRDLEKRA